MAFRAVHLGPTMHERSHQTAGPCRRNDFQTKPDPPCGIAGKKLILGIGNQRPKRKHFKWFGSPGPFNSVNSNLRDDRGIDTARQKRDRIGIVLEPAIDCFAEQIGNILMHLLRSLAPVEQRGPRLAALCRSFATLPVELENIPRQNRPGIIDDASFRRHIGSCPIEARYVGIDLHASAAGNQRQNRRAE